LESIERAEAGNESYFQGLPGQVAGSSFAFLINGKKSGRPKRNGHFVWETLLDLAL